MKIVIAIILSLAIGLGGGIGLSKTVLKEKNQPKTNIAQPQTSATDDTLTSQEVITTLRNKKGSEFDKEFLTQLMSHNQTAIEMASLAEDRAQRDEIKRWAEYVSNAQVSDINQMKTWYNDWGFLKEDQENNPHQH
jgi:uncharacterized protein (DUF305 family)